MTVCVAGKNRIAVECTDWLLQQYPGYKIVACINNTDNGIDGWQPSFSFYCRQNNIPVCTLNDLYEIEDLVFISLEYDKILHLVRFKTSALYNIHFSELPAYKGMYTSVMPLLNGEEKSAVTLHKIDAGIDTGDIIAQRSFSINLGITGRELYEHYLDNSISLFKENIDELLGNSFQCYAQSPVKSSYYSKTAVDFKNVEIDINKTAFEIHNQIRAYTFREYQLPVVNGTAVYKSEILSTRSQGKPGLAFQNDWYYLYNSIDFQVKIWIDKIEQLVAAAQYGNVEEYQSLKENGYPISVRTKEGWNAFIIGCHHDHLPFILKLIEDGWDINTCNYKGTSAFMYAMTTASKENKTDVFDYMCSLPVDVKHCDNKKRDILSYAIEYGNEKVIAKLHSLIN